MLTHEFSARALQLRERTFFRGIFLSQQLGLFFDALQPTTSHWPETSQPQLHSPPAEGEKELTERSTTGTKHLVGVVGSTTRA